MIYSTRRTTLVLIIVGLSLMGCANMSAKTDYSAFEQYYPRSILVIPPLNNSVEANAPYIYLSTITRPLAEAGYYVYPVSVVDAFLKDNGLPTPGEMNAVPLEKIRENIGADAVLYVTIEEWGQKFELISSKSIVSAKARLVDVQTGTILWTGSAHLSDSSGNSSGGGLLGDIVAAVIDQVAGSVVDRTHGLSSQANHIMILNPRTGLLPGPYKLTAKDS